MIRKAIAADLPGYVHLARQFHAASPMHGAIDFDDNGYANFFLTAITNPDMGVWLAEIDDEMVGIAGALAYPMYFSPTNRVAQELWWWMTPKARGNGAAKQMFGAIEQWAAEKGVKAVFMIALEDERSKKMENVYARAGYKPMERTFIKEV